MIEPKRFLPTVLETDLSQFTMIRPEEHFCGTGERFERPNRVNE